MLLSDWWADSQSADMSFIKVFFQIMTRDPHLDKRGFQVLGLKSVLISFQK